MLQLTEYNQTTCLGKSIWVSLVFSLCLPVFSDSRAQADNEPEFGIEEIIVTARKREESLQETPISIQAFTADGLEQRGIDNISQIGSFTPNMIFDRTAAISGSNSSAIVYIRGIGQDSSISTIDLGVGTYIDGVYLARSVGGVLDLIDVERIEVLRGPQGTLFGRNTIGGAINITSAKPSEDFRADATLTFGSDEMINGKLTVNGALAENLFAKGAFLTKNRDGYVDRADGKDMGDDDLLAGNIALRWLPANSVTVDLAFDVTESDSNGAPFTLVDVNANAPFPQFHNAFVRPPTDGCFIPPPFGTGSTDSTNPGCYNSQWIPQDKDTDFGTFPANDELDIWGISGTMEWEITDNLTFKSITSYRDTESEYALDQDHSPLTIAHVYSSTTQDQLTQEFQLLGTLLDQKLEWILGFYYFEEEGTYFETVTFSPVFFQSGGSIDNDSLAVFAQGTYHVTDQLSLTAGVRYTDDTKRFTPDQMIFRNNNALVPPFLLGFGPGLVPPVPPPGTLILPNTEAEIDTQEATPMVSLGYQWNDELFTYFTYSEGFKSGGFTQRIFPPQADIPSFAPEFVTVYEAGFKWQGFDNRLRLNAAYFFSDYEDLQIVSQARTVAPIVLNAGEAEVQGFEIDIQAVPHTNLLVEAGLGYIDDEITEIDPGTGVGIDNSLVKTPEWSGNFAISYEWEWNNWSTIMPRLDIAYKSSYYGNAINSAPTRQGEFGLLNLGATFKTNDGKWTVTAIGRNLTDKEYISAGYSEQNGPTLNLGISEVVRNRGREWSVMIKRSFF